MGVVSATFVVKPCVCVCVYNYYNYNVITGKVNIDGNIDGNIGGNIGTNIRCINYNYAHNCLHFPLVYC